MYIYVLVLLALKMFAKRTETLMEKCKREKSET
jgi:hypothetical protein